MIPLCGVSLYDSLIDWIWHQAIRALRAAEKMNNSYFRWIWNEMLDQLFSFDGKQSKMNKK